MSRFKRVILRLVGADLVWAIKLESLLLGSEQLLDAVVTRPEVIVTRVAEVRGHQHVRILRVQLYDNASAGADLQVGLSSSVQQILRIMGKVHPLMQGADVVGKLLRVQTGIDALFGPAADTVSDDQQIISRGERVLPALVNFFRVRNK